MNLSRFRRSQLSTLGLVLSQALGLSILSPSIFAQSANGAKPSLPTPISAQSLVGLDMPPQMVVVPKQAIPTNGSPSSLSGNNAANIGQASDLILLYQEAAFSDPVLNAARFNYQASKELYWQGLSLLLPQASAVPGGTRYYQHTAGNAPSGAVTGSRVYDQKNYTVTLTQPVFNMAALEAFKQGDLNTKIADMRFYLAQQDLIIRVSQSYFDALTSQDNVALYRNKKGLIKQQLEIAQAKFDAGLATIVDVNTAQAALDLANSQEIAAQADLVVKRGILEQLVGRPVGALKPLIKEAKIDGVLKDPRSKSKDGNGIPIADSVNPLLPKGQTLDDWILQALSQCSGEYL
jgi:outer membrane protein